MCHGVDPDPVKVSDKPEKTMGHSKVIAFHLRHPDALRAIALHLVQRLCQRLRRAHRFASRIHLVMKSSQGVFSVDHQLSPASNDPNCLYDYFCRFIARGLDVAYISITAIEMTSASQLTLPFTQQALSHVEVIDRIQQRFGEKSLQPARLLNIPIRSVIPPTWREGFDAGSDN